MSEASNSDAAREGMAGMLARHRALYLGSGGTKGHIYDLSESGKAPLIPTLLLRTIGRKSGKVSIQPLIYGIYGTEWVIIASKGGAADHPGWYYNLTAEPDVQIQVATQCFRATCREAEGEERARVWDYMARLFPPYNDYQRLAGDRQIPVVMMLPGEPMPVLTAD
jgi:deazaflavin-dependent oxidoreductase (nitroreductase family)